MVNALCNFAEMTELILHSVGWAIYTYI